MAPRAHYSADDALHVGAEIGRSGRFETALETGMRQGELLVLTWGDSICQTP